MAKVELTKEELDNYIYKLINFTILPICKLIKLNKNIDLNKDNSWGVKKTAEISFKTENENWIMFLDIVKKDYELSLNISNNEENKNNLEKAATFLLNAVLESFTIIKKQNMDLLENISLNVDNSNTTIFINEDENDRIGIILKKLD